MEAIKDKSINYSQDGTLTLDPGLEDLRSKGRSKSTTSTQSIKFKYIVGASIASIMLIILMVIGYTKMVSINSDIKVIQSENEELKLAIDALKVEMKPYVSKERIREVASKRIGMVYPTETNIVKIKSKTVDSELAQQKQTEIKKNPDSLLSFLSGILR